MTLAVAVRMPPGRTAVSITELPGLTGSRSAIVRRADHLSPIGLYAQHVMSPPTVKKFCEQGVFYVEKGHATGDQHRPYRMAGHESFALRMRHIP
jgi:hypothetical protein